MAIDSLSPVAPARIRVLLLPSGRIKRSNFISFVEKLLPESAVRLGDISPDSRPNRTMFSPLAFPNGMLLWEFTTSITPPSQQGLSPFELFREPLGVIGIADADEYSWLSDPNATEVSASADNSVAERPHEDSRRLKHVVEGLREQYPKALVHSLMLFNCSSTEHHPELPQETLLVPPTEELKTTTIKTILCDFAAALLAEMTTFAKSLQALPTIPSPGSAQTNGGEWSGEQITWSTSHRIDISGPTSPAQGAATAHRMSMPTQMPSSSTTPSDERRESRPVSPKSATKGLPATTFDDIQGVPQLSRTGSATSRASTAAIPSRDQSRDRILIQGFGPGSANDHARIKGQSRVGLIIGTLYLCAGLWQDALRELVEHTNKLIKLSDHLWHAKGLENILSCLLLFAWTGMDFQIPQICYPGAERSSAFRSSHHNPTGSVTDVSSPAQRAASHLVSLQNLSTLIPDLVPMIINIYKRSSRLADETLPHLAFSECIIRLSKLLAAVNLSGGTLNEAILKHLVQNTQLPPTINKSMPRVLGVQSKREIASILFQADPSTSEPGSVSVTDHVMILGGIASVLGMLGLHRKRAIVMKEFIASLIPGLVQARKVGAAEMGVHPAAGLAAMNMASGGTVMANASNIVGSDDDASLHDFLILLGRVYGVATNDPASASAVSHPSQDLGGEKYLRYKGNMYDSLVNSMRDQSTLKFFGSSLLKTDILRMCISFCEALPDFQGVLHFTSALLRTVGPGSAPGANSTEVVVHLTREEQVRLATNITRTVSAAKKLGLQDIETDYWDDFLVRGVELVEPATVRTLSMHRKSELNEPNPKEKGLFIHNPFMKKGNAASEERLLVANESYDFVVALQNPYDFEVEIESLRILGDGVDFHCTQSNIFLGPYRTQKLLLDGVVKSSGPLRIFGCSAKIKGCRERIFPIFIDPWQPAPELRMKCTGLQASSVLSTIRPVSDSSQISQTSEPMHVHAPKPAFLSLTVLPEQPLLVVSEISLPQSAAMVLEGEQKRFTITVRNTSDSIPVDFIHLSFQDSASAAIEAAMSNKELTPAEIHELEIQFSLCPCFRLCLQDGESLPIIAPGASATFEIEMVGRAGLTHGTVQIDYACLGIPRSKITERFYTRKVTIPINVTVNASVQLHRTDVLAFSGDIAWANKEYQESKGSNLNSAQTSAQIRPLEVGDNRFKTLLSRVGSKSEEEDHFLLLLDLRNAWPNPLSVSLEIGEDVSENGSSETRWQRAYTLHEVIQPGHIARVVILLPKIYLQNPHAFIPSLNPANQRQFVVSATRRSPETEKLSREAFWYRDELLKRIRGKWKEEGHDRHGELELRSIRLSPRMVDGMKLDDLSIDMSVVNPDLDEVSHSIRQIGRAKFEVEIDQFVTLKTALHNRSRTPIYPFLRLQPSLANQPHSVALDLDKRLSWSGLLQRPLKILMPGESAEVNLGLCALCRGIFEISAIVEEIQSQESTATDRPGTRSRADSRSLHDSLLGESEKRRTWYSRESCLVVARN